VDGCVIDLRVVRKGSIGGCLPSPHGSLAAPAVARPVADAVFLPSPPWKPTISGSPSPVHITRAKNGCSQLDYGAGKKTERLPTPNRSVAGPKSIGSCRTTSPHHQKEQQLIGLLAAEGRRKTNCKMLAMRSLRVLSRRQRRFIYQRICHAIAIDVP